MSRDLEALLGPEEGIVLQTRQHWFVIFRDTVVLILLLAVTAVAIWYAGDAGWLDNRVGGWITNGLWVVFGVIALLIAWRVLGWFVERFYITTSKVVYVHGILDKDVTSTPMSKIDEVTLCRPLLGRILRYGRLDVENASGGTEPLAGLEYLPRPAEIYRVLTERARHQRMIEGGAHRDDDGDGLADPAPATAPVQTEPGAGSGDAAWKPTGDSTGSR